jgi:outer membrane protein TolC
MYSISRRWKVGLATLMGLAWALAESMASVVCGQQQAPHSTLRQVSPCSPPRPVLSPPCSPGDWRPALQPTNSRPGEWPYIELMSHVFGAQDQATAPTTGPVRLLPPVPAPGDKPLPINLPTALQLAHARPLDIALASQRVQLAVAQLERARVLWLPTVILGVDYFRHDGRIQDVGGNLFDTSKSSFLAGAAPIAVFALTDAFFEPLAARQVARSREAELQTARNDSLLAVAEAYFNVQQARGELAGAEDASRRAEDVVRRAQELVPGGVVADVEIVRARTEASRRRQAVDAARERWRGASADLVRVLRLDPSALIQPLEPPHLQVTLVLLEGPVDDLIPVALTNRPELSAQQALVQATLQRLRQERLRPLVPSVLLRGASTNPAGTLAGGVFGGGRNESVGNFGARGDFDLQVLWELQNLGFGNRARVNERRAENQLAVLDLFRVQDRVAADVVQAYAQAQSAASRVADAEKEVKDAVDSAKKNLAGLGETNKVGNVLILVIRPQEVVAAVQALAQAYNDYYSAVADYNRAQFRLYRALGHPAQLLSGQCPACPVPPLGNVPPAEATPVDASRALPPSSRLNNTQDSPINSVYWRTRRPGEGNSGGGP